MKLYFHSQVRKQYQKLPIKVRGKFDEKIANFMRDEYDPVLNNHLLKGKYQGYRSINITGDIRAVYKKISRDKAAFVTVGKHSR